MAVNLDQRTVESIRKNLKQFFFFNDESVLGILFKQFDISKTGSISARDLTGIMKSTFEGITPSEI
jgi:Ca2+-binding EF-hand superfamily protein